MARQFGHICTEFHQAAATHAPANFENGWNFLLRDVFDNPREVVASQWPEQHDQPLRTLFVHRFKYAIEFGRTRHAYRMHRYSKSW